MSERVRLWCQRNNARITPRSVVHRDSRCDMQPWARARTFTAVPRSTQPSTIRGTAIKCVPAYGLSDNNNGDGGCGTRRS